jgi:cytochrome P450
VPSLANGDPPGHAPLRKVVNRAFTRRRVAELEPGVVATAERLVAAMAPRGHADVLAGPPEPWPMLTIHALRALPVAWDPTGLST